MDGWGSVAALSGSMKERSAAAAAATAPPRSSTGSKRGREVSSTASSPGQESNASKKRAVGLGVNATPRELGQQSNYPSAANTHLSSSQGSSQQQQPLSQASTAAATPSPRRGGAAAAPAGAYHDYLESLLANSPIPSPGQVPGRNSRTVPNRGAVSAEVTQMNFDLKEAKSLDLRTLTETDDCGVDLKNYFYVREAEVVASVRRDGRRQQQQQKEQRRAQRRRAAAAAAASAAGAASARRLGGSTTASSPQQSAPSDVLSPSRSSANVRERQRRKRRSNNARVSAGDEMVDVESVGGGGGGVDDAMNTAHLLRPSDVDAEGPDVSSDATPSPPSAPVYRTEVTLRQYDGAGGRGHGPGDAGHSGRDGGGAGGNGAGAGAGGTGQGFPEQTIFYLEGPRGRTGDDADERGGGGGGGGGAGGAAGGDDAAAAAAAAAAAGARPNASAAPTADGRRRKAGAGAEEGDPYKSALVGLLFDADAEHVASGGVLKPRLKKTGSIATKQDTLYDHATAGDKAAAKAAAAAAAAAKGSRRGPSALAPARQQAQQHPAPASGSAGFAGGSAAAATAGCMDIVSGVRRKKGGARTLPQVADRVLDAPCVVDDFHLQLVDWSEWANMLAVSLNDTVYTWDAANAATSELLSLEDDLNAVTAVSWIQEGSILAVGCQQDGFVRVWDAQKKKQLRQMPSHSDRICAIAWNRHVLTTGSRAGTITHHDVRVKNHKIASFNMVSNPALSSEVCNIQYSPDFSQFAASNDDGVVSIYDAAPGNNQPVTAMKLHAGPVKALSWVPEARHCITTGGYKDRALKMTKTSGAAPETIFSTVTDSEIISSLWSKHTPEFVTCNGHPSDSLSLYSYSKPGRLKKIGDVKGHHDRILHMSPSPDGQTVVSCSADETIRFWKLFDEPKKGRFRSEHTMIGPTYSTIKAAFQLVCHPGNTTLDWEETALALQAVGFGKLNQFQVTDAVQHAKIKSEHEIENKDTLAINFQEFEAMVNEKVRQGGQKAEVHLAFQLFDHDKTGKVSVNNIMDVARDLGDLGEDDETARHSIEHYVHMASGGGSGLSLDQWSKVMGVPLKSD